MTDKKLIKLYTDYKYGEISLQDIIELKELTDEEIDIVLNSKEAYIIRKMFKNSNFKLINKSTKLEICDIINHSKLHTAPYAEEVATNKNVILSGNVIELVKIVASSIGQIQAKYASKVACNKTVLLSEDATRITNIISKCDGKTEEQIQIAYLAAINTYILRSGNAFDIVEMILNAPDTVYAKHIYTAAFMENIEKTFEDALENDTVSEIDFWNLFHENPEKAIEFLINNNQENIEFSPFSVTKKKNNIEISPYARIRRKERTK